MELELKQQKTISLMMLKKALCIFLTMLMLFSTFSSTVSVFATDDLVTDGNITEKTVIDSGECGAEGDNVIWTLYSDGELIISGEGAMADYCDELESYAPWVEYKNQINSVIINEGVTTIGDWAFALYECIKTIDIANTVISIGDNAIYYCNNLISLKIPNSVTVLSNAIVLCLKLESIFLPKNIKLGYRELFGCMSLSKVYYEGSKDEWNNISYSFDSLSLNGAEIYCNSIGIGTGHKITEEKFKSKELITSGNCGDNDTNLNWSLYGNGTLVISGYGDMADYAWKDYYVNGIGDTPWSKYHAEITDLVIEDGVTSIGENAFYKTKYLKSIEIPDSVTNIGESAFGSCPYVTAVKIGNGVTTIPGDAFEECVRLNKVEFGDNIKRIDGYAFYCCYDLTDVYFDGTYNQWQEIFIDEFGNEDLFNAMVHFNKDCNVTDGNITDGNITDGNVTDGNVTDGNVTDDNVSDGNVTDGNVTDGNITDGNAKDECIFLELDKTIESTKKEREYSFIPEKSGVYTLSSESNGDPYCILYDAYMNCLDEIDDSNGLDFELSCYLESGNTYYFYVGYYDYNSYCNITLTMSDIASISFTPAKEYVLTEGFSDGYYRTRWVYDEENDEEYEEKYYHYELPSYNEGDAVTVTKTDGTETEYIWDYENYDFVSEDGEILNISRNHNQYNYPWTVDGEHNYFTIEYAGATCTVPVTIKANPVESISFTPAEEYVLTEGVSNGYYTEIDSEYEEEYYYYYLPSYSKGDTVTVTKTDGTETEYILDDESYDFVSEDGEILNISRNHNQYNYPWTVDGEHNYFTIEYAGATCTVPVTIKANPVESIELIPVKPYELYENISGNYEDYNEEDGYFYYYDVKFKEGDVLVVNYKDGTSKEFTGSYTDGGYYPVFKSADGEELCNVDLDVNSGYWNVGEHIVTVSYAGAECTIPVTVKECPVESISAEYKYTLYDGYDCELGYWNSERYIRNDYVIFTIKMKDGSTFVGNLSEVEEMFDADVDYSIDLEKIGENTGCVELGNIKGDFVVNIEAKPEDIDKQPQCRILVKQLDLVEGEIVDLQLLEFADKNQNHTVKIYNIPDWLTLTTDGRLQGVVPEVKKSEYGSTIYSGHLDFEVRWDNSYANSTFAINIYIADESETESIPDDAEVIPFNTVVEVEASESNPKWYKFRSSSWFASIASREEVIDTEYCEGLELKILNSNGIPVGCDGVGDGLNGVSECYYLSRGEYYYIRVTENGTLYIDPDMWMPEWTGSGNEPQESTELELLETNVEKTFEGDDNTLWNVYLKKAKFDIDFNDGFIYEEFASMARIASPVNIHMVTEVTTDHDIIYSVNYKYDPNNPEECEKLGASTIQSTMKDELREGEKEYRFDNVYYLASEIGNLVLLEERLIYVPVGYKIEGDHVVVDEGCDHNIINHSSKVPTCTEIGWDEYETCSKCDYTTYNELPATGHSYTSIVTAPTCTEEGYTTYTCDCGDTYTGDAADALGHDGINHEAKAPTCTEIGWDEYVTCSRCDYTTYKEKSAAGHSYTSVVTEPTCIKPGYTTYTCSECSNEYTDDFVKATGHKYTSKVTKAATCSATGRITYTCHCGAKYTETISATGKHTTVTDKAVSATYKNTGLTVGSHCSVCGKVIKKQAITPRLTLSKVSGLKASSIGTTSLKFTWNKVTGAEKYEVYYSTNGKSWKKATTTKNSVTVKKLKTGTTYKVKVRAVAGTNTGSYSSVLVTSTKPSKVTLTKLTSGKKKLTAQWKTISGVTGYEVAYSTSKKFTKKTTKTVTVKKTKTKKTTLKKLKSGKKYYVKVRAYKIVNGKKIYGAYSSVKTVKIK